MSQLTRAPNEPATINLDAKPAPAAGPSRLANHITMTKPRITLMVIITAYIGFALGAQTWTWLGLVGTLVGTALSCMGASVLNQVLEQDTDGLMHRTRDRPLPAGRLPSGEAWIAGTILALLGVAILWLSSNALAGALSAFTILSYAFLYTPLKRRSVIALYVGAIPGAMPPVIGYAGATGTLATPALLLFAIMFVWQIPHFLAIAWLYRDDYARAKLPMLPVRDDHGTQTFRQIVLGCLLLLPLGLMPTWLGVSGPGYFLAALVSGLMFLGFGVALIAVPTRTRARRLFLASLIYLPVVLAAMLIDHV